MKLDIARSKGRLTITRVYDPGEVYTVGYNWNCRKDGYANKQSVENKFPGSKFLEVNTQRAWCPDTYERISLTCVVAERVQ